MKARTTPGLNDFLNIHKRMRVVPIEKNMTVLQGHYELNAVLPGLAKIEDIFHLKIIVPLQYPKAIPQVYELDGKIPRESRYHVFKEDRKSTRLNSSHVAISYAVFCLK